LLPAPLRQRPQKAATQGVQAVGRLDQDTTGLLLLTDDGQFIHRMSSPRHHVPKVYEVVAKHAVDERQISRLLEGVVLDDDPRPVRAAACELAAREAASPHLDRRQVPPGQTNDCRPWATASKACTARASAASATGRSRAGPVALAVTGRPGPCWSHDQGSCARNSRVIRLARDPGPVQEK
jgi:16S rRNA pseudouridine516 synthase